MKRWKGFISGFITAMLVLGLAVPAFAAYQKQATLNYNNIKVTLDGAAIVPKDANGKAIEPFTIDGTTYLPVRGIASALNLDVSWNQNTSTVALTSKESGSQTASGTLLAEKNGVKIYYTGLGNNSIFGPEVKLLIENNSNKTYTIQVRECSVNGFMIEPMFSAKVASGKKANDALTFMSSDLKESGITSIETVELYFRIIDWDNYTDTFETSMVTINCK